ncbi:MAG TPA: retention module-containing protein, partial [Methylotenera sp.]|nr:retention module-containing protein [Methylotenera sp.]
MALIGKVVAMTGVAYLITDNGSKRELQLGDQINVGDSIQTPRGVEVDLELASGRIVHISAEQLVAFTEELSTIFAPNELDSALNLATIETVIKAIDEGKDINAVIEETAAGLTGMSSSYGFGFVDLFRINDILNAFRFAYSIDSDTGINNELLGNDDNNYASLADSEDAGDTPNNAPVATSLSIGRAEGTGTIVGSLPASDVDGDTLVYNPIGVLPAGLVINPDGSFTFDYSDPAYDGLALGAQQVLVVPYEVSDGKGGTSSSTLTITIDGANDAPVANDDAITVAEDTPFSSVVQLDANDTDVDGNPLILVAGTFTTAQGGSIIIAADGSYTYTPALNFNGTDSVNYTVTDGSLTDIGTLSITVNAVTDLTAADDSNSGDEDTTISGSVAGNDST